MDIEQEARNLGWNPDYSGQGKLSAEEFVARGKEILPILRKNNEHLQAQVTELKTLVADAAAAAAEFRKYHEETAERAYQKAVADLNAEKVQASKDGEFERVAEIDNSLRKLDSKAPIELKAETKAPDPKLDPVYSQWADENPWVKENGERTKYAAAMASYIRAMEPSLQGRPFLDRVAEEVETKFNGKGKKDDDGEDDTPPKRASSKVEGGGRGNGRIAGKSFADLPAEAKSACDRFAEKLVGPGKTFKDLHEWRARYVADYDWS